MIFTHSPFNFFLDICVVLVVVNTIFLVFACRYARPIIIRRYTAPPMGFAWSGYSYADEAPVRQRQ